MSMKSAMLQATMMGMMSGMMGNTPMTFGRPHLENGVERTWNPWDTIQLSKAQRKGKSFEELQALRKEIYLSENK